MKLVRLSLQFSHVSSHTSIAPLAISIGRALRLTKTLGGQYSASHLLSQSLEVPVENN